METQSTLLISSSCHGNIPFPYPELGKTITLTVCHSSVKCILCGPVIDGPHLLLTTF